MISFQNKIAEFRNVTISDFSLNNNYGELSLRRTNHYMLNIPTIPVGTFMVAVENDWFPE